MSMTFGSPSFEKQIDRLLLSLSTKGLVHFSIYYLLITLVLLMLNVEPRGFDFFVGCCIFQSLFAAINEKKTAMSALHIQ